jgi:hypothetical protein
METVMKSPWVIRRAPRLRIVYGPSRESSPEWRKHRADHDGHTEVGRRGGGSAGEVCRTATNTEDRRARGPDDGLPSHIDVK